MPVVLHRRFGKKSSNSILLNNKSKAEKVFYSFIGESFQRRLEFSGFGLLKIKPLDFRLNSIPEWQSFLSTLELNKK